MNDDENYVRHDIVAPSVTSETAAGARTFSRRAFLGMLGAGAASLFIHDIAGGFEIAYADEADNPVPIKFVVLAKDEVGFAVVDANSGKPIPKALIHLTSLFNKKVLEGTSDNDGIVVFNIADMCDPDDSATKKKRYVFVGQVTVIRPSDDPNAAREYRDFDTGMMQFVGARGTGVVLQKSDGKPYVRRVTFDGWDILYASNSFAATNANDVDHELRFDIVAEKGKNVKCWYWAGSSFNYMEKAEARAVDDQNNLCKANGVAAFAFNHQFLNKKKDDSYYISPGKELKADIQVEGMGWTRLTTRLKVEKGIIDSPATADKDKYDSSSPILTLGMLSKLMYDPDADESTPADLEDPDFLYASVQGDDEAVDRGNQIATMYELLSLGDGESDDGEDGALGLSLKFPDAFPFVGGTEFEIWTPKLPVKYKFDPFGGWLLGVGIDIGSYKNQDGKTEAEFWKKTPSKPLSEQWQKEKDDWAETFGAYLDRGGGHGLIPARDNSWFGTFGKKSKLEFKVSGMLQIDGKVKDLDKWTGTPSAVLAAELTFEADIRFYIGPIPLFIAFDFSAGVTAALRLGCELPISAIALPNMSFHMSDTAFSITVKIGVGVSLGVGFPGLCSVAIRGAGFISYTTQFIKLPAGEKNSPHGLLTAGVGSMVVVEIFIGKWTKELYGYTWDTIWGNWKKDRPFPRGHVTRPTMQGVEGSDIDNVCYYPEFGDATCDPTYDAAGHLAGHQTIFAEGDDPNEGFVLTPETALQKTREIKSSAANTVVFEMVEPVAESELASSEKAIDDVTPDVQGAVAPAEEELVVSGVADNVGGTVSETSSAATAVVATAATTLPDDSESVGFLAEEGDGLATGEVSSDTFTETTVEPQQSATPQDAVDGKARTSTEPETAEPSATAPAAAKATYQAEDGTMVDYTVGEIYCEKVALFDESGPVLDDSNEQVYIDLPKWEPEEGKPEDYYVDDTLYTYNYEPYKAGAGVNFDLVCNPITEGDECEGATRDGIKPNMDEVLVKNSFSDSRIKMIHVGGSSYVFRILTVEYPDNSDNKIRTRLTMSKFDSSGKKWGEPKVIEFNHGTNDHGFKRVDAFDYDFDVCARVGGWMDTAICRVALISGKRPNGNESAYTALAKNTIFTTLSIAPNGAVINVAIDWTNFNSENPDKSGYLALPRIYNDWDNTVSAAYVACLWDKGQERYCFVPFGVRISQQGFVVGKQGVAFSSVLDGRSLGPHDALNIVPIPMIATKESNPEEKGKRHIAFIFFYNASTRNMIRSCHVAIDINNAKYCDANRQDAPYFKETAHMHCWPIEPGTLIYSYNGKLLKRKYELYHYVKQPVIVDTSIPPVDITPTSKGFKVEQYALADDGKLLYFTMMKDGPAPQDFGNDGKVGPDKKIELYQVYGARYVNGKFTDVFPFAVMNRPLDSMVQYGFGDHWALVYRSITQMSVTEGCSADVYFATVPYVKAVLLEQVTPLSIFVEQGGKIGLDVCARNVGNVCLKSFTLIIYNDKEMKSEYTRIKIDTTAANNIPNTSDIPVSKLSEVVENAAEQGSGAAMFAALADDPSAYAQSVNQEPVQDEAAQAGVLLPGVVKNYRCEIPVNKDWHGKMQLYVSVASDKYEPADSSSNALFGEDVDGASQAALSWSDPVAFEWSLDADSLLDDFDHKEDGYAATDYAWSAEPDPKPDDRTAKKSLAKTGDANLPLTGALGVAAAGAAAFAAYSARRSSLESAAGEEE